MSLTLSAIADRKWYDIIAEYEEEQRARSMRMTTTEWTKEVNRLLRIAPAGQIVNVLGMITQMDVARAAKVMEEMTRVPKTQEEADWALWQDMVNEPEKYGDDIIEWLALDEQLCAGPKRWRVAAFWLQKEQEKEAPWRAIYSEAAKEAAVVAVKAAEAAKDLAHNTAATVIQAAVRGHQERTASPFLDCCMCLAHRICPLQTDVGMMCRDCYAQGPYTDITGPIADEWNWIRAEAVDLAARPCCCENCTPTTMEKCRWCFQPLSEEQWTYCDGDCETSYNRELLRDMRDY